MAQDDAMDVEEVVDEGLLPVWCVRGQGQPPDETGSGPTIEKLLMKALDSQASEATCVLWDMIPAHTIDKINGCWIGGRARKGLTHAGVAQIMGTRHLNKGIISVVKETDRDPFHATCWDLSPWKLQTDDISTRQAAKNAMAGASAVEADLVDRQHNLPKRWDISMSVADLPCYSPTRVPGVLHHGLRLANAREITLYFPRETRDDYTSFLQALLGIGNLNVEKLSIMGGITPDQLKLIVTRCLGHLVHLELYDVPKATLAILPDALAQRRAEFVHKTLETLVVHDLSGIDTKIAKSLADLDGRHKVAYRHFEIDLNHPLELSQNVMTRVDEVVCLTPQSTRTFAMGMDLTVPPTGGGYDVTRAVLLTVDVTHLDLLTNPDNLEVLRIKKSDAEANPARLTELLDVILSKAEKLDHLTMDGLPLVGDAWATMPFPPYLRVRSSSNVEGLVDVLRSCVRPTSKVKELEMDLRMLSKPQIDQLIKILQAYLSGTRVRSLDRVVFLTNRDIGAKLARILEDMGFTSYGMIFMP